MKTLIVLFSGMIIAAGAAAQTERTATPATQAAKAGSTDHQAPVTGERGKRENPAQEHEDSANSVSTDFQGSSKQETTASGMGQVKKDGGQASKAKKTESDVQDVQDVEDKTKR